MAAQKWTNTQPKWTTQTGLSAVRAASNVARPTCTPCTWRSSCQSGCSTPIAPVGQCRCVRARRRWDHGQRVPRPTGLIGLYAQHLPSVPHALLPQPGAIARNCETLPATEYTTARLRLDRMDVLDSLHTALRYPRACQCVLMCPNASPPNHGGGGWQACAEAGRRHRLPCGLRNGERDSFVTSRKLAEEF